MKINIGIDNVLTSCFIVLAILKLTNILDISWTIVFIPVFIYLGLGLILLIVVLFAVFFAIIIILLNPSKLEILDDLKKYTNEVEKAVKLNNMFKDKK